MPSRPPSAWPSRLLLAVALVAVGIFLYGPTFRCFWAQDDMDYLNLAADVLAGKQGFWRVVFWPHAEHLVPVLRLGVLGSVALFGPATLPYRLVVFATHLGSAWCLSAVARRYSASQAAAWAAGLAYLIPCGFASTWVWFNTGAGVTIGTFGITAALAVLAHRERLGVGRARWLAAVGIALALLSEGTLAPLLAAPALLDEYERRRSPAAAPPAKPARGYRPGGFAVATLALAPAWMALSAVLYARTWGGRPAIDVRAGLPRTLFLLATAPFRLFFPGIPLLRSGLPTSDRTTVAVWSALALTAVAAALLAALFRRGAPPLLRVAGLAAVGPLGVLGLVGIGRAKMSYPELYGSDRYFFFLLVPLALLAGAVAAAVAAHLRAWPRRARIPLFAALALFVGGEIFLQRQELLDLVPFGLYAAHETRFRQLVILGRHLSAAARALPAGAPPLLVPDSDLLFPDIHNGRLSTRLLLYILARHRDPRLQLGGRQVGERDAALVTAVLAGWARDIGEPLPSLAMVDGRLVNARVTSFADFAAAPHDEAVAGDFYDWEAGGGRWMGERATLRLTLPSPLLLLTLRTPIDAWRKADPSFHTLHVTVTGVDTETGWSIPLGLLPIDRDGARDYYLDATRLLTYRGAGHPVQVVLSADRTFRPFDVLPDAQDRRRLSVQVVRAGAPPPKPGT